MTTLKNSAQSARDEQSFSAIVLDKDRRIAECHGGLLTTLLKKPLRKGVRFGGVLQQLGSKESEALLRAAIVNGKTSTTEVKVGKQSKHISIKVEPIVRQSMIEGAMVTMADISMPKKNEAFDRITAQMTNLSLLAKNISHRLNNPLAAILNQIGSLLLTDLATEDRQRLRRELIDIQEKVYGLSLITNALDLFARDVVSTSKLVQVNTVLEKAIDLARLLNVQDQVKYRLRIDAELPPIIGNEISLEQCFLHLLRNAQEAIHQQGNIDVQARINPKNKDFIEILIKDDGSGIPKEHALKIYEPFFTTKGGDHLGLGICISYTIIHTMKGYMDIDSDGKNGTKVSIWLPIAKTISKRG